jgi:hypothetical protein
MTVIHPVHSVTNGASLTRDENTTCVMAAHRAADGISNGWGWFTVSTRVAQAARSDEGRARTRPRPSWEFTRAAGLAHGYDLGFTSLDLVTSNVLGAVSTSSNASVLDHGIQIGVFHRNASSSSSEADRHSSVGCGCSVGCS